MGFELTPGHGDRGEPDVKIGRVGGSAVGEHKRLVGDGVQLLARGAFVCPGCALPMAPVPRLRPKHPYRCGFCGHRGAVADFVRGDVFDTPANEVRIVARLSL